jgi:hypothetical protein
MYFKHTGWLVALALGLAYLSACSQGANMTPTATSSGAGSETALSSAQNAAPASKQRAGACGPIDERAASDILGVSAVRAVNSWHESVNNSDDLVCVYNGAAIAAVVPSLKYELISPSPALLGTLYAGMSVNPKEQHFDPGVGVASSGATGSIEADNFHATILLKTNAIIVRINVSGLPSADAAKAAALKAASKFQ